jgi:hypothetical protein
MVLDDETAGGVWYPDFRTWLVDTYVRPLGRMLFPDYIGGDDDDNAATPLRLDNPVKITFTAAATYNSRNIRMLR